MSEQQAEYDTDTDTDPQPTAGPWGYSKQSGEPGEAFLAQVWGPDGDSLAVVEPTTPHVEEATANARVIAAAGTAAQEAKEMGYDPVAAVKGVATYLDVLEHVEEHLSKMEGHIAMSEREKDLLEAVRGVLKGGGGDE